MEREKDGGNGGGGEGKEEGLTYLFLVLFYGNTPGYAQGLNPGQPHAKQTNTLPAVVLLQALELYIKKEDATGDKLRFWQVRMFIPNIKVLKVDLVSDLLYPSDQPKTNLSMNCITTSSKYIICLYMSSSSKD